MPALLFTLFPFSSSSEISIIITVSLSNLALKIYLPLRIFILP